LKLGDDFDNNIDASVDVWAVLVDADSCEIDSIGEIPVETLFKSDRSAGLDPAESPASRPLPPPVTN